MLREARGPRDGGFLSRLSPDAAAALTGRMSELDYAAGRAIINHDDQESRVFLLLAGQALVTIYSHEGKAVAYRTIETGDMFGEIAAIDQGPRSASVVARSECRVGEMGAETFRALLRAEPDLAAAVMTHLAALVRSMTTRILEFSTLKVKDRLVLELLRIGDRGVKGMAGVVVRPAPTHFELASRISTHREAVSREMSRLTKLGVIKKTGDTLVFSSLERLRDELEE